MSNAFKKIGLKPKIVVNPTLETTLEDWLAWLQNQHAQEIHLGLERVQQVAQNMNLLQWDIPAITVAGTNGKGSSVAMLSSIYQAAGYQVGTYTSPHLLQFNERIQCNGQAVSDLEIVRAFEKINLARGDTFLSYFEFATLAALFVFKQRAISLDIIILEVGLGGRLDAVNIIDGSVALITAIGVDHIDWLGSDREQIGAEKAGIMRPHQPAVCSDMNPPKSIQATANQLKTPLFQIGSEFDFALKNTQAWAFLQKNTVLFDNLPWPSLKGQFQIQNAAGVLEVIALLQDKLPVPEKFIAIGLQNVAHPGRLQSLQKGTQTWWLDVAHNPQSAQVLANYLEQNQLKFECAIFSVLADKEAEPMIQSLRPFIQTWVLADLHSDRSMTQEALQSLLLAQGIAKENIRGMDSIKEAVSWGMSQFNELNQLLVFGSFLTVSQAMEALSDE